MSTRRALGSLLGALLLFGMLALPASAGVQTGDVVILNGQARVGNMLGDNDDGTPLTRIPEQGDCNPTGKGLHAPGFHGSGKNKAKPTELGARAVVVNKEVFYRLDIPVGATAAIVDTNNPARSGTYEGSLDVCGIVSPGPGGIGAACGSSTGRDGKGKLDVSRGTGDERVRRVYMLQNVAWVTAVGGVLPVYGHITEVQVVQHEDDPDMDQFNKRTKLTAKGTFQGAVNAQGAAPCIDPKPGGARGFTVNGTVASEALGKPAPKARETKLKKQN